MCIFPNYSSYTNLISVLFEKNVVSCDEISVLLNIDQAKVKSWIQHLQSIECPIEISNDKVSIVGLPPPYSIKSIKQYLPNNNDIELNLHVAIDSTNDYLKSIKSRRSQICLAEYQDGGKGRRGKNWLSPFAGNVYCSFKHVINVLPAKVGPISLIVGIAIIDELKDMGYQGLMLKWPNDIYVDAKKLAGVLIEVDSINKASMNLIVGIGLNCKIPDEVGSKIDKAWIDLFVLNSQIDFNRNEFVGKLISRIINSFTRYENNGWLIFESEWCDLDLLFGKQISVINDSTHLNGKAIGVNTSGELLVEIGGTIKTVNSGEVSVSLQEKTQ